MSISEQICESNSGKPSIFAEKQPHYPSCPYYQGGSSCASAALHEGSRVGPWAGGVPTALALDTVWDGHGVSEQCWEVMFRDRGHVPSVSSVLRNGGVTEHPSK